MNMQWCTLLVWSVAIFSYQISAQQTAKNLAQSVFKAINDHSLIVQNSATTEEQFNQSIERFSDVIEGVRGALFRNAALWKELGTEKNAQGKTLLQYALEFESKPIKATIEVNPLMIFEDVASLVEPDPQLLQKHESHAKAVTGSQKNPDDALKQFINDKMRYVLFGGSALEEALFEYLKLAHPDSSDPAVGNISQVRELIKQIVLRIKSLEQSQKTQLFSEDGNADIFFNELLERAVIEDDVFVITQLLDLGYPIDELPLEFLTGYSVLELIEKKTGKRIEDIAIVDEQGKNVPAISLIISNIMKSEDEEEFEKYAEKAKKFVVDLTSTRKFPSATGVATNKDLAAWRSTYSGSSVSIGAGLQELANSFQLLSSVARA